MVKSNPVQSQSSRDRISLSLFYMTSFSLVAINFSVFSLGNYHISLPMFFIVLYIVWSIVSIKKFLFDNVAFLLMFLVLWFLIGYYYSMNYTEFFKSFLLLTLFAAFFLFSSGLRINYKKIMEVYIAEGVITSLYGIYEFIGRIFHLPFTNFYIPNHMVEDSVPKFFGNLPRIHSVFVEPSHFAIFLALPIVYILILYLDPYHTYIFERRYIPSFIVMLSALLLTFSLSGFLIIFLSLPLYLIISRRRFCGRKLLISLGTLLLLILSANLIIKFFSNYNTSLCEIILYRINKLQQGVVGSETFRSIGNLELIKHVLIERPFHGFGIGQAELILEKLQNSSRYLYLDISASHISSIYVYVFVSAGLVGFSVYLIMLFSILKKIYNSETSKDKQIITVISIQFLLIGFFLGGFLTPWPWIYLSIIRNYYSTDFSKTGMGILPDHSLGG